MPFQLVCVEESLCTAGGLASGTNQEFKMRSLWNCVKLNIHLLELLDSFVQNHVAAQVGFSLEATTTTSKCAQTRALWTFRLRVTFYLFIEVMLQRRRSG